MEVVDKLKGKTIIDFARAHITEGSTISSDAYRSYSKLQNEGFQHEAKIFNPKENSEYLKWPHTIFSNAKSYVEELSMALARNTCEVFWMSSAIGSTVDYFRGNYSTVFFILVSPLINSCLLS
jgi:hypothetical protein